MSFESVTMSKIEQTNNKKYDMRDDSLSKLFAPTQKINKLKVEMKTHHLVCNESTSYENIFGAKRRLSQLTYFEKPTKNQPLKANLQLKELPYINERYDKFANDPKTNWSRSSLIIKPKYEEELRLKRLYQMGLFKTKMTESKQQFYLKRNYLTNILLKNPKIDQNKVYYYMRKYFVK
jgi:hypothetical protein